MPDKTDTTREPLRRLVADYPNELTQASYREIEVLAMWARTKGPSFYLIGGWAAWRYHHGLGSRDIDVVFPNQSILDAFLTEFYLNNGYKRNGGLFDSGYQKQVMTDVGPAHIEIDAAQLDRGFPFHENPSVDLPYRLLEDFHQVWKVGQEEIMMPTPELLLLQKVKAHRDRSWDLQHAQDATRANHLRGKVAKDAYDIQGIAPHVEDWEKVRSIAHEYSCSHLVFDTLKDLGVL